MAQITSSVGLVSGINTGDIINELISLEQAPVTNLQTRVASLAAQKQAYTALGTSLTSLQGNSQTLAKESTFQNATADSSDETVATATATAGASVGSYQLQVARLVTTQQVVSAGFADYNSSKVGAGTISIGVGGGELTTLNSLSDLNGGAGVRRGQFRITDRSGNTAVIDTSAAVTLQDVIKKINTTLDVQVHASLKGNQIVLQDTTGKALNDLTVTDVGDGHAAADLGLVGNSAGTDTLTGTDINYLGVNTSLAALNDGNGIHTADSGADFSIQPGSGAAIQVNLSTAKTVGDVLTAINTAAGTRVKADLNPDGSGIRLTDTSGGGGSLTVTALNGSLAAHDLGIDSSAAGAITGRSLVGGLGTVLLSSLNGGSGFTPGTITIKDRAASSATSVDLSGASTVQDILDKINTSGAHVVASVTDAGDAIQIQDTSGGTGSLQIGDSGGGTTAQTLGLAGTFDSTVPVVKGANLHRQYVSESSQLSTYNGGKGVATGSFQITNSAGASATIQISANQVTIGDVIQQINNRGIGVTASVNANGNGILLTDTAGGGTKLKVVDVDSTTAADLSIAGTATGTTIDGAQEKTIDVTANDTLATLQTKINSLNFGVTANIINDGTAATPFRLSLTAKNSGNAGRVVVDAGTTALNTTTLVAAQNAAVFLGGVGSENPLLITASSNQIAGAIKGVTINLNGVSDSPVTLNVSQNADAAVDQVNQFVTTFNAMADQITTLTSYDTSTNQASLLLGDPTVEELQSDMYQALATSVPNNGKYRVLQDVGISLDDNAKLVFDEDKFRAAYADDPEAVQNLFSAVQTTTDTTGKTTTVNTGLGGVISDTITKLVDPVSGVLTRENSTLDEQTQEFNDRISELNDLIAAKRTRLEQQFANMETVLAQLQSQQSALGSFTGIKPAAVASSSSSSSTSKS